MAKTSSTLHPYVVFRGTAAAQKARSYPSRPIVGPSMRPTAKTGQEAASKCAPPPHSRVITRTSAAILDADLVHPSERRDSATGGGHGIRSQLQCNDPSAARSRWQPWGSVRVAWVASAVPRGHQQAIQAAGLRQPHLEAGYYRDRVPTALLRWRSRRAKTSDFMLRAIRTRVSQ